MILQSQITNDIQQTANAINDVKTLFRHPGRYVKNKVQAQINDFKTNVIHLFKNLKITSSHLT